MYQEQPQKPIFILARKRSKQQNERKVEEQKEMKKNCSKKFRVERTR